jgi:hypothetical protein
VALHAYAVENKARLETEIATICSILFEDGKFYSTHKTASLLTILISQQRDEGVNLLS